MLGIGIEASHSRGMGHLFRVLNLLPALREAGIAYHIFINRDEVSEDILDREGVRYTAIDYDKPERWVADAVARFSLTGWYSDKFETSIALASELHAQGVKLAVVDDHGEGASLADVHFAPMLFDKKKEEIPGKVVYTDLKYIVLNPEIQIYRRIRKNPEDGRKPKILVTLGGSDTYGATCTVVRKLIERGYGADIVLGPHFADEEKLRQIIAGRLDCRIDRGVPSMIEKMSHYDLAITGGGMTCFEANASGLPSVIVANEPHEILTGQQMESYGGSRFAGFHSKIEDAAFDLASIDIESMSRAGMEAVPVDGAKKVSIALIQEGICR